jgi:hypothetical protein
MSRRIILSIEAGGWIVLTATVAALAYWVGEGAGQQAMYDAFISFGCGGLLPPS